MKISVTKKTSAAAFTLIEMIGVLAVIAILASLLIPKIFNAINDSKINNAVLSYNTMKTAVMEHYGKYGKFSGPNGGTLPSLPIEHFDNSVLLPDALIDKGWAVKIGDQLPLDDTHTRVRMFATALSQSAPVTISDGYSFDGLPASGPTNNIPTGASVIEVVITGVPAADAKAYNDRLDGTALGSASGPDYKGRVKYGTADGSGNVEVRTYIAHR